MWTKRLMSGFGWLAVLCLTGSKAISAAERLPNFVIIFIDDMGYADIGPFGAEGYTTPHLDRLAREGRVFTDFYVTQAVCSASRAGLLTGCYNVRVGIQGALSHRSDHGLHADEMTLAEVVKQKDYATACYGKWHLGHHPKFLPTQHGFDDYFGLPYSNDMWPLHPTAGSGFPPLPLFEGTRVINADVQGADQEQLTTWITERAVRFIEQNKDRPFLLYLPHPMVHVPLYVSDRFRGHSARGLFGDVVMELDWSVGQIVETLRAHGLDEHTLVIFTTDNGPWLSYGDHAGSARPLREGKGTMFDGGCRVPTVMWWPGTIPADSVCREPAMTIDLLPTLAHLIDAQLPEHPIDGRNIWPLIAGEENARSPQEAYYFYYASQLQAMRMGRWKLHFPHAYQTLGGREGGRDGVPVPYEQAQIELSLFDLEADVGETTNVADQWPDVVAQMRRLADAMRADLGDAATQQQGTGIRPAGQLDALDPRFRWIPGQPLDTEARADVLAYLKSLGHGSYLFGQMATWVHNENPDMDHPSNWIRKVHDHSGVLPRYGCITYDFDDDPFSDGEWNAGVKKLWDRGMIVGVYNFFANPSGGAWNDPCEIELIGAPGENPVKTNFYSQLDRMAANLQWLKDQGMVVVYTPFVESDDRNKWHAKQGSETIIELYRLVHDYFQITKGLDNIIWAYHTTQGDGALERCYPGDDYVDILGKSAYGTGLVFSEYEWAVQKKKQHGKVIWWAELGIRGKSDPPRDCLDVLHKLEDSFPELAGFVFWSDDGFYNVVGNRHAREFMAHPKIITLGDHHGH